MKTAAIISCNDNYDYETRTKYVCDFLYKKGYVVTFLIADFDHRNKKAYSANRQDDLKYIHVRPYEKNLSIQRIRSHLDFAKGVKNELKSNHYDLIYHCAPPNSTIRVLSNIRKSYSFKLITEIGDLWPETMPVSQKIKKIFWVPLGIWRLLRDKYLFNSDVIIAECNLFKTQLEKNTGLKQIRTLYFCKKANFVQKNEMFNQKSRVVLCYLGSINNIIDCDLIGLLVRELAVDREVIVHIIGDGEKRDQLIDSIKSNGGHHVFYGKVFSEKMKKEIFSKSDYCLNIMKTTVSVGMTMKSLDYFSFGLPIINNVGGDIGDMVIREAIGFNIDRNTIKDIAMKIKKIDAESYLNMLNNVRKVHNKYFCVENFNREMEHMI